ncbi:MAG: RagB/SusD family nutrient uptake outer membrane protein [Flavobacteriales bacterium]
MKLYQYFLIAGLSFGFASCDHLLEFEAGDVILAEDAIQSTEDLQRLLVSNYDVVANLYGGRVQIVNELRGPNFGAPDNSLDFTAVYNRETTFFTGINGGIYTDFYYAIYRSNVVIKNFDIVEDLNDEDRLRLEAEARFIRAICHWGAVKMYARPYGYTADNSHPGVPLRLEPSQDPLPRAAVGDVYQQIVADLTFAAENLPIENGVYATQDAAKAYLAQVHFLMGNYSETAAFATEVINSGRYTLDDDLDRFETDVVNPETVFGIVSMPNDFRSSWFRDNLRSDNNPTPQLAFSEDFAFFMSLSGGGDGRSAWLTAGTRALINRFNEKEYFNVPLAHLTMLHLMRAESYGELGTNLETAIADINAIRARAFGTGNNDLAADASSEDIITAARDEYRKETACEGHWTDQLLRRGAMGEAITIRGASWDCPGMSLQFSNTESTVQGFELNEEGGCL